MKKKLLIYGAGAIGRGYIPWVFSPNEYEYYYVEINEDLRNMLNVNKKFTSYRVIDNKLESLEVPIKYCYNLNEAPCSIIKPDAAITAVGPRNISAIVDDLKGTTFPIICCENDSSLPEFIKNSTGNNNAVFAIPDVITSNTAPENLKKLDPLSIVTENGVCFVDKQVSTVGGNCQYVSKDELWKQWMAKLYLHNTPHCIAAYLGAILKIKYLHDSMKNSNAEKVVEGAMREMQQVLLRKYKLDEIFINWYADKELKRFKNVLLYDPISRVAREPFRKLRLDERLIGASQLCISCGVVPENIMTGIMAAFYYDNPGDQDANIKFLLNALTPKDFLKISMGLREGEALFEMLLENWDRNINILRSL